MLGEVLAACEVLGDAIGATDVLLLSGADCAQLVEALARSERRCSALAALAADRAPPPAGRTRIGGSPIPPPGWPTPAVPPPAPPGPR